LYKANQQYPVYITAKDFDNNGSYTAITSIFKDHQDVKKKEFPAFGREDMLKQMISMKRSLPITNHTLKPRWMAFYRLNKRKRPRPVNTSESRHHETTETVCTNHDPSPSNRHKYLF